MALLYILSLIFLLATPTIAQEEPEEPAPEEPAPEEPAPEEPAPEEPAPEEPAPEEPAPEEPAPEEPAPEEPAPEEPATGAPEEPATGAPEEPATGAPEEPATGAPEEPAPEEPATGPPEEPAPEEPATGAPEEPATGAPEESTEAPEEPQEQPEAAPTAAPTYSTSVQTTDLCDSILANEAAYLASINYGCLSTMGTSVDVSNCTATSVSSRLHQYSAGPSCHIAVSWSCHNKKRANSEIQVNSVQKSRCNSVAASAIALTAESLVPGSNYNVNDFGLTGFSALSYQGAGLGSSAVTLVANFFGFVVLGFLSVF